MRYHRSMQFVAPLMLMFIFIPPLLFAEELKPAQKQYSSVSATAETLKGAAQPAKPVISFDTVYVVDFDIDSSDIKKDTGVGGRERRGLPFGSKKKGMQEKLDKLVNTMSETMLEEFNKKGVKASRISRLATPPKSGILVGGSFTLVDEGSRMKRAVIGFGKGEVKTEVYVKVYDLAASSDSPAVAFGSDTNSRKMPGAVVTMNPYAAAAKFFLEKNATEKVVKRLAETIAEEILGFRATPVSEK